MVELYYRGNAVIVAINNELLVVSNYSAMSRKLRDLVGELDCKRIIFDLSNIKVIDSVGMGLLAMIKSLGLHKGIEVVLACEDSYMLKIIKILNMNHSFNIYRNVADAIDNSS